MYVASGGGGGGVVQDSQRSGHLNLILHMKTTTLQKVLFSVSEIYFEGNVCKHDIIIWIEWRQHFILQLTWNKKQMDVTTLELKLL